MLAQLEKLTMERAKHLSMAASMEPEISAVKVALKQVTARRIASQQSSSSSSTSEDKEDEDAQRQSKSPEPPSPPPALPAQPAQPAEAPAPELKMCLRCRYKEKGKTGGKRHEYDDRPHKYFCLEKRP